MFCLRSSDVISSNDSSRHGSVDLPSPACSSVESDTSDYPRSTPSPRDHDSGIGSLEEFSDSKDTDPGLGDELLLEDESSRKESLGKEEEEDEDALLDGSPLKKRLFGGDPGEASSKKLKLELIDHSHHNGKISEYLNEMKHFKALRKEKLDRVLNLKTDVVMPLGEEEAAAPSLLRTTSIVKKEDLLEEETHVINHHHPLAAASNNESERLMKPEEGGGTSDTHQFEVPKAVVRFPSRNASGILCRWESCGSELESSGKLIDHLKTKHASLQMKKEEVPKYKCLWEGCKVYGKTSCSKSWLEKHIITHGGNKPFQCIVDGCKQRFSTQSLLERHVNSHFKSTSLPSPSGGSMGSNGGGGGTSGGGGFCRKSVETFSTSASSHSTNSSSSSSGSSTPKVLPKVIKKAGRRLKYRKTIFSARLFDLFDIGIMAQLQEKLVHLEHNSSFCRVHKDQITLTGSIIAKKRDEAGKILFLMRWTPLNLLKDEWVEKSIVSSTKTIRISTLSQASKDLLSCNLLAQNTPSYRNQRKFVPIHGRQEAPVLS